MKITKGHIIVVSIVGVALIVAIMWKKGYLLGKIQEFNTEYKISQLHPKIRGDVKRFIKKVERKLGVKLRIPSTGEYRSFQEQDALYAQGRARAGNVVTDAKAGQSYHNYGLAVDLVPYENGRFIWKSPKWNEIGGIGEQMGFTWGKSWGDKPHFQKTYGNSWRKLLAMKNRGEFDKYPMVA